MGSIWSNHSGSQLLFWVFTTTCSSIKSHRGRVEPDPSVPDVPGKIALYLSWNNLSMTSMMFSNRRSGLIIRRQLWKHRRGFPGYVSCDFCDCSRSQGRSRGCPSVKAFCSPRAKAFCYFYKWDGPTPWFRELGHLVPSLTAWVQSLEPMWWKERTNSNKLSFHAYKCTTACVYPSHD